MPNPIFARMLVGVVSAGWLVPLWLGVDVYAGFMAAELRALCDTTHPLASFPYLAFANDCLATAFVWLGAVVACWSYAAFARLSNAAP
jgi:hypothetical protein